METRNQRVCIAGSASASVDATTLAFAQAVVSCIVRRGLRQGASFVTGIGRDPLLDSSEPPLSLIFDWTVAKSVWAERGRRAKPGAELSTPPVCVVTTQKTMDQIPDHRKQLWKRLTNARLVDVRCVTAGWTAGALRRRLEAGLADILIAIGGGQGVEHLAAEFAAQNKPVIPLGIPLGASCEDGRGALALFERLQHSPENLLSASRRDLVGAIAARMKASCDQRAVKPLVAAVFDLIKEADSPHAFYVRLLNPEVPEFQAVEQFFRRCVDPVVKSQGFVPIEMGRTKVTEPWMNVGIFRSLHYSAAVVVDLTGLRQNCFMELGYAFGRNRKVILTARRGTQISFDASAIEAFLWSETKRWNTQRLGFARHWERNLQRAPIVASD